MLAETALYIHFPVCTQRALTPGLCGQAEGSALPPPLPPAHLMTKPTSVPNSWALLALLPCPTWNT